MSDSPPFQSNNNDTTTDKAEGQAAVNIIRSKIKSLYQTEPDATEELTDAEETHHRRSRHQQFIHELSQSGKSLAEIQTEWHNYYLNLPDNEKHAVWQEFYAQHGKFPHLSGGSETAPTLPNPHQTANHAQSTPRPITPQSHNTQTLKRRDMRTISAIKKQLTGKVVAQSQAKQQHFKSLLFGAGLGTVVLLVLLFGFFNERFIAPLITPSRQVSNTPIVIDPATTAVGSEPKIIIPKINVEIPVVYGLNTTSEATIQDGLEGGVVHYATTPNPGEQGNTVVVGHSSNNIFNQGKYKFAFVLLKKLEIGDTFYMHKNGKRFAYRVYEKKIVKPTDVSVLGATDKPATATLITCDPPGTSLNRLIVLGEQITPDPATNVASTAQPPETSAQIVPGNSPSLWSRIRGWFTS